MDPLPQVLSKTYSLLNTPLEQPQLHCLVKWETDLNRTFTVAQKQNIIRFSLKSSICTKIQENNFQILTRWYLTHLRLHRYYPATLDHCWRCQGSRGTILHIFWSCPKLTHILFLSPCYSSWKVEMEIGRPYYLSVINITDDYTNCQAVIDVYLLLSWICLVHKG